MISPYYTHTTRMHMHKYTDTVWPEILAGNLFWRIGGFESNPPIFHPPKLTFLVAWCHNYCIIIALQLNARLIVGMELTIDSCVRGHHVSKEYWIPALGKELACQREEGNPYDVYAVAVKTNAGIVVGHLPRKISAACSLFLRRSGTIVCQITGSRRPSSDLPQGGLEAPCTLKFAGEKAFVDKIRTLLMPSFCPGNTEPDEAAHVSSDKKSSHSEAAITVSETASDDISIQPVWLSVNK